MHLDIVEPADRHNLRRTSYAVAGLTEDSEGRTALRLHGPSGVFTVTEIRRTLQPDWTFQLDVTLAAEQRKTYARRDVGVLIEWDGLRPSFVPDVVGWDKLKAPEPRESASNYDSSSSLYTLTQGWEETRGRVLYETLKDVLWRRWREFEGEIYRVELEGSLNGDKPEVVQSARVKIPKIQKRGNGFRITTRWVTLGEQNRLGDVVEAIQASDWDFDDLKSFWVDDDNRPFCQFPLDRVYID